MSRRRLAVLVAIAAALVWAPSSVSAAPPNQLSQASVTPTSGDTSTHFVVSVRYRSPAGNPAITVTADFGVHVAILALVSGNATDGVWSGSTTLPPGSWSVTVRAIVINGPQPSLSAGTVSVAGATLEPPPPGGTLPSTAAGPSSEGAGLPSSPAAQPVATPAPRTASSQAPARSSVAPASSQPPVGPAASADAAPVRPGRGGQAPARTPHADPTGPSQGAQRSLAATPTLGATPASGRDAGDLGLLMLMGTLAVAVVALVGSAWIILAGRRERRAATAALDPSHSDPGVEAAAIVEQLALRRARVRSADDPILAAMGLPDESGKPSAPAPSPRRRSSRSRGRRRPMR